YFEEADDKPMRQATMFALDDYLYGRHDGERDGVAGPIGGFRLWTIRSEYGDPGDPVERYAYDPLAPVPSERGRVEYNTPRGKRKDGKPGMTARCKLDSGEPDLPEPDL